MTVLSILIGIFSGGSLVFSYNGFSLNPRSFYGQQLLPTLAISGLFVSGVLSITLILALRTASATPRPKPPEPMKMPSVSWKDDNRQFKLSVILSNEFEYARETAFQAMEERRSVVNFYLLIFGGAGSAVVGLLSTFASHIELLVGAIALLWLVCFIGVITLFTLVSLRLAWLASANDMNHVKEFYLENSEAMGMQREALQSAFFFHSNTLPSAGKHWNANHYAALLVGVLDSAAFLGGAILLGVLNSARSLEIVALGGGILAIFVFMAHWWAYDLALLEKPDQTKNIRGEMR